MPGRHASPAAEETVLSLRGVSKSYPGVRALRGVHLDVRAGEIHGLLGQNGAGKSTLVKMISGVERPDEGVVELGGQAQRFRSPRDAQLAGVHTIFQELSLVPHLTIAENVYLSDLPRTRFGLVDWKRLRSSAEQALRSVGFDFSADRVTGSLSIAEQQGVEIAKAVHHRARVLLLDEPTATLPRPDVQQLFALMRRLRDQGDVAIIFISHRLDEIFEICDRVTILRDGQKIQTTAIGDIDPAGIVRAMVGPKGTEEQVVGDARRRLRDIGVEAPPTGVEADVAPCFNVQGLGDGWVLRDIALSVRPGEAVGVAGLVGSGLSELANCLFGNREVTEGTIQVGGKPADVQSPRKAIDAGIGLVPEDRKGAGLVLDMDISKNATMANLSAVSRLTVLSERRELAAIRPLAQQLAIKASGLDQRVGTLSGGNQQKVVLAKWMLADVDVLVVQEPTRGVDVGAKEEIYAALGAFLRHGGAVLLLSSELSEALMCDRIHVMSQGRLVAEFDHADVSEDTLMSMLR